MVRGSVEITHTPTHARTQTQSIRQCVIAAAASKCARGEGHPSWARPSARPSARPAHARGAGEQRSKGRAPRGRSDTATQPHAHLGRGRKGARGVAATRRGDAADAADGVTSRPPGIQRPGWGERRPARPLERGGYDERETTTTWTGRRGSGSRGRSRPRGLRAPRSREDSHAAQLNPAGERPGRTYGVTGLMNSRVYASEDPRYTWSGYARPRHSPTRMGSVYAKPGPVHERPALRQCADRRTTAARDDVCVLPNGTPRIESFLSRPGRGAHV